MKMPPPVNCRLEGWARYNDNAVVVVITGTNVRIICGPISSRPDGGDKIADNITQTAVWGNEAFNDCADSADDAHERDFKIEDPHLLKRPEALILCNEEAALVWFKDVHPPEMIKKISKALRDLIGS